MEVSKENYIKLAHVHSFIPDIAWHIDSSYCVISVII
jgi:hypothetical protein